VVTESRSSDARPSRSSRRPLTAKHLLGLLQQHAAARARMRCVLAPPSGSVVRRPVGWFARRPPTVVYRSLDRCEAEVLSARQRSGAPPITYPLKPAQAMTLERHSVRPAQRQARYSKAPGICLPCLSRPRACGAKRTRNSTWVPLKHARSSMARLTIAAAAAVPFPDICLPQTYFPHPERLAASRRCIPCLYQLYPRERLQTLPAVLGLGFSADGSFADR
jgi:hypothetical protein